MLYKPNRKETKQIKGLNKGYKLMQKGFAIVMKHTPKNDGEISVYAYRASKNMDSIIKRVAELLEAQYVDRQFFEIVKNIDKNKKKKRK